MSGIRLPPRPQQSPHLPYNPQNYAQTSHLQGQISSPSTTPALGETTSAAHPPYNPAAYHDNSIANAANQIYGPPIASYDPSGRPVIQPSSPQSYHPQYPVSPRALGASHVRTSSNPSQGHRYTGSAPLPIQADTYAVPSSPQPASARISREQSSYLNAPQSPSGYSSHNYRPSPSPEYTSPHNTHSSPVRSTYSQHYSRPSLNLLPTRTNPQLPDSSLHSHSSSYSSQPPAVPSHAVRHPQSRPLPGPPAADLTTGSRDSYRSEFDEDEAQVQQNLFDEVESALNASQYRGSVRTSDTYDGQAPASSHGIYAGNEMNGDQPSTGAYTGYYDDYGEDDSDAEAAAGLEAMRMAEQQEADEHRRRSHSAGSILNGAGQTHGTEQYMYEDGSDDDYHNVDMEAYGGGYQVPIAYGDSAALPSSQELSNNLGSQHLSRSSRGTGTTGTSSYPARTDSHSSATSMGIVPNVAPAVVDEAGTGGLSDPAVTRKLSFDDNDQAEVAYLSGQARDGSTTYDQFPTPGSRPLPNVPTHASQGKLPYPMSLQMPHMPQPDLEQSLHSISATSKHGVTLGPYVPRSHSLAHSSATQQTVTPIRAKTDAEERKRISALRSPTNSSETSFQGSTSLGLDLPALPTGRRLQPSKLREVDYDRCSEPWALSSVIHWLRNIAEGDPELRTHAVEETLVHLFMYKVPNMNIATAEALSAQVISRMLAVGTLVLEEEWLRFGPERTTGVLFQLSGLGCYSQRLHDAEGAGRCYSHFCQRTVRKVDLRHEDPRAGADWATFHGLKKEDVDNVDRKEVERQNNLHEIIQSEYHYMNSLKILRTLYWDNLEARKNVMSSQAYGTFVQRVFGKLNAVQLANQDFLLPQLKYRQKEQGPWLTGFSDIFRDWIRKAKPAYIEYTANFPTAEFTIRQEERKNLLFHSFLDEARNNPVSQRLAWDNYLKAPITKIQRYSLLLQAVLSNMKQESEEKTNLQLAITEIQEATRECNARLDEETRKIALADLKTRLILRPEMKHVELNLTQWGREIIFAGDLQRTGTNKFTWLESHVMLLDNYLVLAKTIVNRDTKSDLYDVSKMPIPMDLLQLESNDDDPVIKSSMKGIASVSSVSSKVNLPADARMNRTIANQSGRPGMPSPINSNSLTPVATNTSSPTMTTNMALDQSGRDDKILYPFRIRHLGKEVYTLFASTANNRKEWCDKIVLAKTKHAASLFTQNAEPFRLKVIADTAFAYDTMVTSQRSVTIKGTPLVRAIEDVERTYTGSGRPAPVCRARVNCATSFRQPDGRQMVAVGTDYGVYVAEAGSPRSWTRAIPALRVTSMAVLEEFSLFLLISDKSLIAYHLDVVYPVNGAAVPNDSMRKAPQKLSGTRDVGFFAIGRMKDRTLVFYEKRDGRTSVFKVLEPVYQKNIVHKSRHHFFRGQIDFFRDYDDFYIPADCTAIDLFQTSLSVATARGFEVLNLDKKQPWSIPELKAPHVATIAQRLQGMDPVAMFRLAADGSELLCVYEECAVYVNKYGDVSRSVVMEFVGRARSASLVAGFLVLFDQDFVEVRDALNGRLKQVVAGRDIRCLDSARVQSGLMGASEQRTVKFALQHPETEKAQLVVELVLNEGRRS